MERVGALISKLQEQYEQHVDADAIAITAQMLLAELQQQKNGSGKKNLNKVAVTMPVNVITSLPEIIKEDLPSSIPSKEPDQKITERPQWMFDTIQEVPTLVHQKKEVYELNETIVNEVENSLNEKLRVQQPELADVLHDTPIKDLKKAIGVNDRYLFINELFRGDETMYERSIKTINSFTILPEAQYWIERELKLKLAWPSGNEAVEIFDQLVKRRFS